MITEQTIQKIRDAAQIEEVVRWIVPDLKKSGANYRACCPFHGEKTPSFYVAPAKGLFKCFGCGIGGDAITFIMKANNLDYPAALEYLAQKYAIEIERSGGSKPDPAFNVRQQVHATLAALQAYLAIKETAENPGRAYWKKRGFNDETLDLYGVGYCPTTTAPLIDPEALKLAGVANEKGNLSHYQRTTLPLHDYRGGIVSMVGRAIKEDQKGDKYLNGRTVQGVYEKGKFLYNLHRAEKWIRIKSEIWIVEGYADSMALTQMGRPNNVALCGTALTEDHIHTLKKYNGERSLRFLVALDAQTDSSKATYRAEVEKALWKAVQALLPIGEVRVVLWPLGCKDAGDMVERGISPEMIKTEDAIEHYIRLHCTQAWQENASPIEKAEMQDWVSGLIAAVGKDNARDIYINTFCSSLQISPKGLDTLVRKFRSKSETDTVNRQANEYPHIKVCDEYLERQVRPGNEEQLQVVYVRRSPTELKLEGVSLKDIPRFHNWTIEPEHVNYVRILEYEHKGQHFRFFNQYHPLPILPKKFDLPAQFTTDPENFDYEQIPKIRHTARFFKHIFGYSEYRNQFLKIGWDWLACLYLAPRQRLPALALVSVEEGTGKSTFINLMLRIFGQNATKTDAHRIGANFNSQLSGKVLAGVEETKDEKGKIETILKDLVTGFEMTVERKYQEARTENTFCKFVFASNHESDFMKVGTATTRFFVMRVNPIEQKDPSFEEKLYLEIPYLLYFLQKRGILYNGGKPKDRLFFEPADYENEALIRLRQASKDIVQQNLEELATLIFLRAEMPSPFFRITSEYLKILMQVYGGKIYEQKSPNYFQKVAANDMRLVYRDKPTSFYMPEMQGIYAASWLTANNWEYTQLKTRGRFIEFPIWRFCSPSEVIENYPNNRIKELQTGFAANADYLAATYGPAPAQWLESLNLKLAAIETEAGEEIPF